MRRTASQPAPTRKSYEGLKAVVAAPDITDLLASMGSREELRRHTEKALRPAEEYGWKPYTKETGIRKENNNINNNNFSSYTIDEMNNIRNKKSVDIIEQLAVNKREMIKQLMLLGGGTNTGSSSSSHQNSFSRTMMMNKSSSQNNVSEMNNSHTSIAVSPLPANRTNNNINNSNSSNNFVGSPSPSLELAQKAARMFSNPQHNHHSSSHDDLPVFGTNVVSTSSQGVVRAPPPPPPPPVAPRKKYFQTGQFHQKILALLNKVSDDEEKFTEIKNELIQLNWSSIAAPSEENASEMRTICSHFLDKACLEKKFVKHYARLAECIVSSQELKEQQLQVMKKEIKKTENNNNSDDKKDDNKNNKNEQDKDEDQQQQPSFISIGSHFREQLLTRCERSFIGYFEKELERETERRRQSELKGEDDDDANSDGNNEDGNADDNYERESQKKKMIGVVRFAAELYLCGVIRPTVIQTIIVSLCAPIDLYLDKQEEKEIAQDAVYHLSDAQCDALHVLFESCGDSFAMTDIGIHQGVPQVLYWADLESNTHPKARAKFLMMNVRDMLYPFVATTSQPQSPPPPPPDPTLSYDENDYSNNNNPQQQSDENSYVPPHKRSNNNINNNANLNNNSNNYHYDAANNNSIMVDDEAINQLVSIGNNNYNNNSINPSSVPFSREKLNQTMSLLAEHNIISNSNSDDQQHQQNNDSTSSTHSNNTIMHSVLQVISSQFDPVHFLVMWMKRCLTVNRCQTDRLRFPKLLATCVEQKIISRQMAKFVISKNIEYMIDEQLWEDVPNLWDNWACLIGVGTQDSFVSVESTDEQHRLNFDEDLDEDTFESNNNNNVHQREQQQEYNNGDQNQEGVHNSTDSTMFMRNFKKDPVSGLYTNCTLLLHPAWHNNLLSRILSLPTSLYAVMSSSPPTTASDENSNNNNNTQNNDENNSNEHNNVDNSAYSSHYESRNNIMTIARHMIEGVVRYNHEHPRSFWEVPAFLWQSANNSPPRICSPRFRFLAVLCKFASMNELHVFVRSVVEASAVMRNCSFEAQFFLSLVDGVRPNLNTVLGKHPYLSSPMMPMVVAASITAACITLKNEKYRSVPDWLLAAIDGKNRGVREALCLYEIASSGFWIGNQTNYLSWGFRFVSFLREVRVISDDVIEAVRNALNSALLLSIHHQNNIKNNNNNNNNNGNQDNTMMDLQQQQVYQRHTTLLSQIEAMLGPQMPTHLRRIQSHAVKTIKMNQMKRIQQELSSH